MGYMRDRAKEATASSVIHTPMYPPVNEGCPSSHPQPAGTPLSVCGAMCVFWRPVTRRNPCAAGSVYVYVCVFM